MNGQLKRAAYPAFILALLSMSWTTAFAGLSPVNPIHSPVPAPPPPPRNSSCQLTVNVLSPFSVYPSTIQTSFIMNAQNNTFYDVSLNKSFDSQAGGDYLGDIATLSYADVYMTIAFNPQTKSVIEVQKLGVDYTVLSSHVSCRPSLKAPSCSEYVANLYQTLMSTVPSPSDMAHYTSQCESGQETRDQIQVDLLNSPEFVSANKNYPYACGAYVDRLMTEFLFEPPSADSTTFTLSVALCQEGPQGLGQAAQAMIASPAYVVAHSSSSSTAGGTPFPIPPRWFDSSPSRHFYTGPLPNTYPTVESPMGQQKLGAMNQATKSGAAVNVGSPDLMPHGVADQ